MPKQYKKELEEQAEILPPTLKNPDFFVRNIPFHSFCITHFQSRYHPAWSHLEKEVRDQYGPCLYRGGKLIRSDDLLELVRAGGDDGVHQRKEVIAAPYFLSALELPVVPNGDGPDRGFIDFCYIQRGRFTPRFLQVYDASGMVAQKEIFHYRFTQHPREMLRAILTFHLPEQQQFFLENFISIKSVKRTISDRQGTRSKSSNQAISL